MIKGLMQAAVFEDAGDPMQVIEVRSVPVPDPGADEVLVRIEGSPIHPADEMFIAGRYRIKPAFPQVAGLEGGGVIVQAGTRSQLPVGTRVAFRHPGCWAEFAAVPTTRLFAVPKEISPHAACQFSLNALTAWALLDEAAVGEGDWLVVNAASSTVAGIVRGLARRRGVQTVNLYRGLAPGRPKEVALTAEQEDLGRAILHATHGKPIAALLDCIGGGAVMRILPALRAGATIVSYGVMEHEPAAMGNADLIYRNLTWKGFGIDHWLARHPQLDDAARVLWRAIEDGDVLLPVRSTYPLTQVNQALREATTQPNTGKTLIAPQGRGQKGTDRP